MPGCEEHKHLADTMADTKGLVIEIHTALMGTMDKPGLVSRFAKTEADVSAFKRGFYYITGSIAACLIVYAGSLILKVIHL